ncbi:aminoglycoside adenylyltransferase domain-containing protein [Kineococcus sp. SYSU DK005]|uniref:aminoglycoside adenylyltransferase domain-containing protein n=1 Tax=Kineococcus sp. SYSU DK005 TaxID=3383126 RepID=UPI003D7E993C
MDDANLDAPDAAASLYASRQVLDHLIEQADEILGEDLVGAYQVGSFALGGGDAASDVDFLIVLEHDADHEQEAALRELHARLPDLPGPWAQHLEGSYAPREQLRRPAHPPRAWLYVDNGDRHLQRSTHDDSLATRWVAREHGIILAGPAPSSLIDPINAEQLRLDALQVLAVWDHDLHARPDQFQDTWSQQQHVLGLCRLLHRSLLGVVTTKVRAGRWALSALQDRWHPLIEAAIGGRRDGWARLHQPVRAEGVQATHGFHQHVMARAGLHQTPTRP